MAPDKIAITLNGTAHQVVAGTTLAQLLAAHGWLGKRVAVEHNGTVVPKSALADVVLAEGDTVEIVVAVGGG